MRLQGQGAKSKHGGQSWSKAERKADFKWPKIYDLGLTKGKNSAEMEQGSVFSLCEVFYMCNGLKWRNTSTTTSCGRVRKSTK